MEPRIQYTKASDGVSIAYWTLGEGEPLVLMAPAAWSNIAQELEIPLLHNWYKHLASQRTLVRFDTRGTGMSERNVEDFTVSAMTLDLGTVLDHLHLKRCDLAGFGGPASIAVRHAAERPESVARLVLWSPVVNMLDLFGGAERFEALMSLAGRDWDLAVETLAHAWLGWAKLESHELATYMRETINQKDFLRGFNAVRDVDVSPWMPQVSAQTLVLQHPDMRPDHSQIVTSRIPGAQLVRLAAGPLAVWEHEEAMRLIEEFLGIDEALPKPAPPALAAFQTILFTDIEGSTALTDRLGDAAAREVMREHERITREALRAHGGSEVKTMGDGFMASFGSATKALECAVAIQQAFAEALTPDPSPAAAGEGQHVEPLKVRVGLNAGEPIAEDDDLFGTAVIVAARIAAQAQGGEILVSDVVRQLVAGKRFLFNDRGEAALKGFEDPVRVWEVRTEA